MAAAFGGPALGGSNPHPNPSGGSDNRLQSPPGKRSKPVALADITNTGRPNATRSLSIADVVKENAKLLHLLTEKTKVIEVSRVEMHKLLFALQASRQQNLQLAQTNSQMLVELNMGKDRLKTLQHELSCTTALLKAKRSEVEHKNKIGNQRRKNYNSQEDMKVIPSKVGAIEAHQIDGSVHNAVGHHLVESQSAMSLSSNKVWQEPQHNAAKKREKSKRKSEISECIKDTNIMQDHTRPHSQNSMLSGYEDPRKPQRRRSSRLNPESCVLTEMSNKTLNEDTVVTRPHSQNSTLSGYEDPRKPQRRISSRLNPESCVLTEVSNKTLNEDTVVPSLSVFSTLPITQKDMKSLQNEYCAIENGVLIASELKKIEINEQAQKEGNLKEIKEAYSRVPGVEVHQIGDKASKASQNCLAENHSSLPFRMTESPKPPEDTGIKRGADEQKLKLCKNGKDLAIENASAKCNTSSSELFHHKDKRKSSRLSSAFSDMNSFERPHEDVIAPLASSSLNASIEQTSMKSTEGQVTGRRSLRRAAEKVASYKEIPLNVKMRRP